MLESTELSFNARPTKLVELGNGVKCGGKSLTVISGPCAVEDLEQMKTVAESLTFLDRRPLAKHDGRLRYKTQRALVIRTSPHLS